MTQRQKAISWFENLESNKQKSFMIGELQDRNIQSLTGREIENIYEDYINKNIARMNLFYSKKDKTLIIIPKYYFNGSGSLVYMLKCANEIKDIFVYLVPNINVGDICCSEIYQSMRYKNNWRFSVKCEECPIGVDQYESSMLDIIS